MPTGYTAGILDGSTTTFADFAKQCSRGFGAMLHMRDESFDEPYKPAEVSSYHKDKLSEAKEKLKTVMNLSAEQVFKDAQEIRQMKIDSYEQTVEKVKNDKAKLETMLSKIKAWPPPTEEHNAFKDFMIDQVKKTIQFDCSDWAVNSLQIHREKMAQLNVATAKTDYIKSLEADIEYHMEELAKEIDRVEKANEWISQLFKSLPTQ